MTWSEISKQIEDLQKKVVSRGDGYDVVHCHGEDKGKSLGHHDTKEEAMAQHRAIEASKHSQKQMNGKHPTVRPTASMDTNKLGAKIPKAHHETSAPDVGGTTGSGSEQVSAPKTPETIASMIKEYIDKVVNTRRSAVPVKPAAESSKPPAAVESTKPAKPQAPTTNGHSKPSLEYDVKPQPKEQKPVTATIKEYISRHE